MHPVLSPASHCRTALGVAIAGFLALLPPAARATTFSQWKSATFSAQELADPLIGADMADPDGDGFGNLLEYAFGCDPFSAEPVLVTQSDAPHGLIYPERIDATDLLYHFCESTDLRHWVTVNSPARNLLGTENGVRLFDATNPAAPADAPRWFVRLRVRAGESESLFAPTQLSATIEEPFAVVLGWNDNAAIEEGHQIERGAGEGFVPLTEVPADTNRARDEAVVGSATYTYRVSAFQGELLSEPSNAVTVTLPLDSDGDGLSDEAELNRFGTDPFNPDTDGDGMPDGWEAKYGLLPSQQDKNSNGIPDGLEDFDGDTFTNMEEYLARLDPTDATNGYPAHTESPAAPGQPAVNVSTDGATVTWTDNSETEFLFHIERSTDGGTWERAGTLPANTTEFVDGGLDPEAVTFYRVVSRNNVPE